MPTIKTYPFQHQPIRLTPEQLQHPLQVFAEFFDNASLGSLREDLRRWYEAAISSEYEEQLSGVERSNLFFLYNQLEVLAEAAFVLSKKSSDKKNKEVMEDQKKKKRKNGKG